MTTVAYKGGVMACDSAYTYNDRIISKMTKIRRTAGGCLFGSAGGGDSRELEILVDCIERPEQLPTAEELRLNSDQEGLLVFPDGHMFLLIVCQGDTDEPGIIDIQGFDGFAIGSGGMLARAAMLQGATAWRAIEIAIQLDINSHNPVHTLEFPLASL